MKAPAPKSGSSTPKKSYSPGSRAELNCDDVRVAGQPSAGGLDSIERGSPETGTTKFSGTSETGSD